jgi:hypothetical protein
MMLSASSGFHLSVSKIIVEVMIVGRMECQKIIQNEIRKVTMLTINHIKCEVEVTQNAHNVLDVSAHAYGPAI